MVYRGGLESLHFSANGPQTGLAFPDNAATRQVDDANTGGGASTALRSAALGALT